MQDLTGQRVFQCGDDVIFDSTGMERPNERQLAHGRELSIGQKAALDRLRDRRSRVRGRVESFVDSPNKPPAYHITAEDGTPLLVEVWRILGRAPQGKL